MDEHQLAVPFDEVGTLYDESFTQRSAQIAAGAWVVERTGPRAHVLDLGCGAGWPTAQQLAEAGCDVVGVDVSERMLEIARERVPSGEFLRADMRELPEDIGRFDAATAFFSLLMLSRADIAATLAELAALLRPEAPLAIAMIEADLDNVPIDFLGTEILVSGYPADQLADVVTNAGFTVESVRALEVELAPGHLENHIYLQASVT